VVPGRNVLFQEGADMYWLLLLLTVAPQTADSHHAVNERGATVMGFDQDKTAHPFLLYDDYQIDEHRTGDATAVAKRP
jgi:hypothetical protein